jgi:hypothetical protein
MPYDIRASRWGSKRIDERVLTGNITLDAMVASVLCYGATAARTVTLPAGIAGRLITIFNKASTATITFVNSTAGTVQALKAGKACQIMLIGTTWRVFKGTTG